MAVSKPVEGQLQGRETSFVEVLKGIPGVVNAAVGVVLITVLTIGYQAVRAALANPVRTLRSE